MGAAFRNDYLMIFLVPLFDMGGLLGQLNVQCLSLSNI